jgi:phenylalanyl-tRNA synthetase beta chain
MMDGDVVAQFGILHSHVAAKRKLRQEIYLAEIFADRLLRRGLRTIRYTPLSKFPAVGRDFSFIFADEITFEKIEAEIDRLGIAELQSFSPVEIFRGGSIEAGKYSVLLSARFQSMERTLREDEVAEWSGKMVAALQGMGGAQRA